MAVTINGSGQVPVQVKSTTKTDTFSTTTIINNAGSNGAQVTGLTATITPSSASNKILIIVTLFGAGTSTVAQMFALLLRNSTIIGNGTAASNRPGVNGRGYFENTSVMFPISFSFLDSPATTSSITYSVNVGPDVASTVYVNRTQGDTDANFGARTSSTITVMEISG
jgi:hypothetical protein